MQTIRIVLLTVMSLLLAVAPLGGLPQTAEASVATRKVELSAAERAFIGRAGVARDHAMNTAGTVMNYAKMRTAFAPAPNQYEVSWRRQMAAGARWGGARITNISSAENAAVNAIIRANFNNGGCPQCRSDQPPGDRMLMKDPPSPSCGTGRSATVTTPNGERWKQTVFLNSCQTNNLLAGYETCALYVGLFATSVFVKDKSVGTAIGLFAAICGTYRIWLGTARDNSDVRAIGIRTGKPYDVVGPNGNRRTFVDTQYFSQ